MSSNFGDTNTECSALLGRSSDGVEFVSAMLKQTACTCCSEKPLRSLTLPNTLIAYVQSSNISYRTSPDHLLGSDHHAVDRGHPSGQGARAFSSHLKSTHPVARLWLSCRVSSHLQGGPYSRRRSNQPAWHERHAFQKIGESFDQTNSFVDLVHSLVTPTSNLPDKQLALPFPCPLAF